MNRYTEFLIRNRTLILALVGCLSLEINDDFDELGLETSGSWRTCWPEP